MAASSPKFREYLSHNVVRWSAVDRERLLMLTSDLCTALHRHMHARPPQAYLPSSRTCPLMLNCFHNHLGLLGAFGIKVRNLAKSFRLCHASGYELFCGSLICISFVIVSNGDVGVDSPTNPLMVVYFKLVLYYSLNSPVVFSLCTNS